MGFFRRLFKPFKKIADKVFDFVTDTVKAAVDIVASHPQTDQQINTSTWHWHCVKDR